MNFKFLNKLSQKFTIPHIISAYKNREYYFLKYFNKPKTTNINKDLDSNKVSKSSKPKIEYK